MKKKLTLTFLGLTTILVALSIFYVEGGKGTPPAPSATIASADNTQAADSVKTGESAQPAEEVVYMFPQPETFNSNPPREGWEDEILHLARGPGDDVAKAERLLSMIPRLNEEGRVLAVENAVALIPDKDYLKYRGRLLALAHTDEMREVLMTDVLSRDDDVRFMTLVELLRQPPNKGQEDVKEVLIAYLDKDYGADANAWEQAVRKFVAESKEN